MLKNIFKVVVVNLFTFQLLFELKLVCRDFLVDLFSPSLEGDVEAKIPCSFDFDWGEKYTPKKLPRTIKQLF